VASYPGKLQENVKEQAICPSQLLLVAVDHAISRVDHDNKASGIIINGA
jgi:hypothetical protein